MVSFVLFVLAVLAAEWALIINVNRPLLGNKSAQRLAVVFAVILLSIAFGILIWI